MPSPFPGMDPFIESQQWPDFHATFIPTLRELLVPVLRPNYLINVERSVFLTSDGDVADHFIPDAHIFNSDPDGEHGKKSARIVTLEPNLLTVPEPYDISQKFLTIRTSRDEKVVTVIELLSPTNKDRHGGGQSQYLAKRTSYLRAAVNVVEIDLLRGGRRLPTMEQLPAGDYHTFIIRAGDPRHVAVYSWPLNDRLPVIPVPLETEVPDVGLDLQQAFEQTYDRSGYDYLLHYDRPVAPDLPANDSRWVQELLKNRK